MNKLQQVEFEILKEFICICNELGLTYYLVCGSALGAAKYNGFIPWDDDIDVALPREEYDIFCHKAQSMLPDHLFLQNYTTDKSYPLIFSKIRHSGTTFVEKPYSKTNMNHGIYIDVFPLDGYPVDVKLQKKLEREKHRYNVARLCCLSIPRTWKTVLLVTFQKLCGIHKKPEKIVRRLEKYITRFPTDSSEVWCNHGNWQGRLEYASRDQYGNGVWTEFEGLRVRIPEKIDEYLTQKYGDWKSDPPQSEMIGHHYYHICDTKRSYIEYIEKINSYRVKFKNIIE